MKKETIIYVIACLFMLLFAYTGVSKIIDQERFENVLHQSPLVRDLSAFVSWALPITELIVVGLLFFESTRVVGLWCSLVLMVTFTVYLGYMLLVASHLPCSCGGVLRQMNWVQHLIFNICFLSMAVTGLWLDGRPSGHSTHITYSAI